MNQVAETKPGPRGAINVSVTNLFGNQAMTFEDLDSTTPIGDIVGQARSRMNLSPAIEWQVQDSTTSRLLREDERVGEYAREGEAKMRILPDARLG